MMFALVSGIVLAGISLLPSGVETVRTQKKTAFVGGKRGRCVRMRKLWVCSRKEKWQKVDFMVTRLLPVGGFVKLVETGKTVDGPLRGH